MILFKNIKNLTKQLVGVTTLSVLIACSPVGFEHNPSCGDFGNQECEVTAQGIKHFDNTLKVDQAQADILFIDDNSGSMSVEQSRMGEKFPNFINSLGNVDFNIAITTTDVSHSPNNFSSVINQFGDLQDGKLINFSNGQNVLNKTMSDINSMFKQVITRPETITCDNSGFLASSCPSPDERGVFAANLAVDRNDSNFFRPASHLAMIVLSDEDERSKSGEIPGYGLESRDLPQSLVDNVKAKFGADKSFSFHAIIIKPGDTNCLNSQNRQTKVKGFEGKVYNELVQLTNGTVGSICANDYGAELGTIGSAIADKVNSITLACRPLNDEVAVVVSPEPAGLVVTVDAVGHRVNFNQNLPAEATARVIYDCVE